MTSIGVGIVEVATRLCIAKVTLNLGASRAVAGAVLFQLGNGLGSSVRAIQKSSFLCTVPVEGG